MLNPQLTAIQAAVRANKSIIVEAGAGCGKTTAIVKVIAPELPNETLFLAFNKSIADELAAKMPARQVKTFHSICLSILTRRVGKLPIDANKYKKSPLIADLEYEVRTCISDIISHFQLSAHGAVSQFSRDLFMDVTEDVSEVLDLPEGCEWHELRAKAFEVFEGQVRRLTALSFDDMLWFTVHYAQQKRWVLKDYKCVVVDEAQDVSPIRLELVRRFSDRCIAVGDRRQAIYAFAGALTNALDKITELYGSVALPLSVTWRCSRAVVARATAILNENFLEARPEAPQGIVSQVNMMALMQSRLDHSAMVVCRTNKPLMVFAMQLLKARTPFQMLSDFPRLLEKKAKKLLKHWGEDSGIHTFRRAVFDHYEEIIQTMKTEAGKARVEDERDSLLSISEQCTSPSQVLDVLVSLINSKSGVKLCTGHKAKGLEAETVYIISPDLLPAPWVCENDVEAMQQETNLHYVMATRAKTSLYYVEG